MAQQRNLPTTLDDSNQVSSICSALQPSGMNTPVVSTTSSSHGGPSLQVSQQRPAAALGLDGLSVPPAHQLGATGGISGKINLS